MIRRVTRWVDMLGMPHLKNGDYLVPVWNKSDGKDYPITIEYDDGEPVPELTLMAAVEEFIAAEDRNNPGAPWVKSFQPVQEALARERAKVKP